MNRKQLVSLAATVSIGLGALVTAGAAQAFNFGDMMNPGRWFGGDRDRYYDRYDRYGYGGPYGGWGGPYGGWGGPYGYGGPWGGGYGPYGWGGGYPGGYGPGSTIVVTPQSGRSEQGPPPPRLPE
ncbi:MAG: hypothetical protein ACM3ST_00595 [Bdellovibrio bacteriovorus]